MLNVGRWLFIWLIVDCWLIDCLIVECLIDWLIDCLLDCLIDCCCCDFFHGTSGRRNETPRHWRLRPPWPSIKLSLGAQKFNSWNLKGSPLSYGCFWFPLMGGRWHVISQLAIYTTCIPLVYCQVGDYMLPTTYWGNQKQPLTLRDIRKFSSDFQPQMTSLGSNM